MKTAELFDDLLSLAVSYPRTLAMFLVTPKQLFSEENRALRCSPAVFLTITLAIIYFAINAIDTARVKIILPEWMKPDYALAIMFGAVAVLVNVQASLVSRAFTKLRPWKPDDTASLAYSYSICLLVMILLAFTRPEWTMTYAPAAAHTSYLVSLFITFRFALRLGILHAIAAAIYGHLLFVALSFVVFAVALAVEH